MVSQSHPLLPANLSHKPSHFPRSTVHQVTGHGRHPLRCRAAAGGPPAPRRRDEPPGVLPGPLLRPPSSHLPPGGRVALLLCMDRALLTLVCCVKKGRAKGEKFSVKQFVPGPGTEQASAEGFTVPPGGVIVEIIQWKSYLPSPPQMTGGGYLQGLLVGSIFQCLVRGARNISSKASRKNAHFYNKQIENLKIFSQYHPKMFKKFKIRILGICFQAQSRWKMHAPG